MLSQFIACDVRRDILIISTARLEEAIIIGQVKTTNILYVRYGLVPSSEFEPPKALHIQQMGH